MKILVEYGMVLMDRYYLMIILRIVKAVQTMMKMVLVMMKVKLLVSGILKVVLH